MTEPQMKLARSIRFGSYMHGNRPNPLSVEVSPSGICTAGCSTCFYTNEHSGIMADINMIGKLLDSCRFLNVHSVVWTGGGEPTMHPDFCALVKKADMVGMRQGLFTNALRVPLYRPEYMEWIRVTITDHEIDRSTLNTLRKCKRLGFAFNYAGEQDDEKLIKALALAGVIGADYVQVRPALLPHGETISISPPAIQHSLLKVATYKFSECSKRHSYDKCRGYHFVPFVWEDGEVCACGYMRGRENYTFGNLHHEKLERIVQRMPDEVPVCEDCQVCCKNHEINKLIDDTLKVEDESFV